MELMYEPSRWLYGTIWNINEGLIYLFATIYFGLVAKNWWPFVSIGYAYAIISTIGIFFYPESPCYLVKKGLYDEAQKIFEYIQKINRVSFKNENQHFFPESYYNGPPES